MVFYIPGLNACSASQRSCIRVGVSPGSARAQVGFDMDYTLAVYKPETFEDLAYRMTMPGLIEIWKY